VSASDRRGERCGIDRELAYTDAEWDDWAARDAAGDAATTILAERAGSPVGIVAAYRDQDDVELFHVIAMWVAPDARRQGVARRLLTEVETWIADSGGRRVQLSVADVAHAAGRLYVEAGYLPDGGRESSRHTPGVMHVSLTKELV
jgi:ribosomal protein S18 acetylase RimI-like enzyme